MKQKWNQAKEILKSGTPIAIQVLAAANAKFSAQILEINKNIAVKEAEFKKQEGKIVVTT
jgi:hypothetical protein